MATAASQPVTAAREHVNHSASTSCIPGPHFSQHSACNKGTAHHIACSSHTQHCANHILQVMFAEFYQTKDAATNMRIPCNHTQTHGVDIQCSELELHCVLQPSSMPASWIHTKTIESLYCLQRMHQHSRQSTPCLVRSHRSHQHT